MYASVRGVGLVPRPSVFLFPSRRRHTRCSRDWSSDVCSSDLLTGARESIDRVTEAANFRYSFSAKTNLFAHASGVLLLTPDGRISRYFYGVEYPGRDMRLGLVDASEGKIGTPIDHVLLFCYQYDPSTATYSAAILKLVRLGGVLTILCLVGGILIARRREKLAARNFDRPLSAGGTRS